VRKRFPFVDAEQNYRRLVRALHDLNLTDGHSFRRRAAISQARWNCGHAAELAKQPLGGTIMATTVDSRRETVSLIGSDKVESTPVYGADDQKIGTVQRVMIDKISGKVAYAVISFGGFLGMGEDYYPMPWASLKYDTNLGGYRVGVTEDQLKGAPKYNRNTDWDWSDRSRDKSVYDYYRAPLWYA
jgi:PRC-barrel domain protein